MFRITSAFLLLLIAGAVLAAPAPKDGWEHIDPDHDCEFDIKKDGTVTIELPGGDHDLNPYRNRSNAPRLLREVEGDFVVQVRVSGSFRPSVKSSMDDEDSRVAAGLVLIPAEKNYIRLEYEASRINEDRRRKEERLRNEKLKEKRALPRKEEPRLKAGLPTGPVPVFMDIGRGVFKVVLESPQKQGRPGDEEQIYLCFERQGNAICQAISHDGKTWDAHLYLTGPQRPPQKPKSGLFAKTGWSIQWGNFPRKLKVGLAAYSTSTEPFKVRFDQFKLIRDGANNK